MDVTLGQIHEPARKKSYAVVMANSIDSQSQRQDGDQIGEVVRQPEPMDPGSTQDGTIGWEFPPTKR